jgi:hypothetical protein
MSVIIIIIGLQKYIVRIVSKSYPSSVRMSVLKINSRNQSMIKQFGPWQHAIPVPDGWPPCPYYREPRLLEQEAWPVTGSTPTRSTRMRSMTNRMSNTTQMTTPTCTSTTIRKTFPQSDVMTPLAFVARPSSDAASLPCGPPIPTLRPPRLSGRTYRSRGLSPGWQPTKAGGPASRRRSS